MVDKVQQFWEDQHPYVRSNFNLGLGVLLLSIALRGVFWAAVRLLEQDQIFTLVFLMQVLQTIFVLLLVLAAYNVLRLLFQWIRGHGVTTGTGIGLACIGIALMIVTLLTLPSVLDAAIAYRAGRSYSDVYTEVESLCQRWVDEWGDQESITLNVNEENLGKLEQEAQVFRVRNSVVFNFSETIRDFGLVCVLDHTEPADSGQAQNYTFYRKSNSIYQFLEDAQ